MRTALKPCVMVSFNILACGKQANLAVHYKEKMNAIQVGNSQIMNILGKGADDLYERYY